MTITNYYSVNGRIVGQKEVGQPASARVDYVTDALGSVVATADQSGAVQNRYAYKPYGKQLAKTGPAPDPAFRWVGSLGYWTNAASQATASKYGDVYVRARHYSHDLANWTTKDPMWPNEPPYVYVNGCPVALHDPSGLGQCQPCCCSIESALQTNTLLPPSGTLWGHKLTTTVTMQNKFSNSGGGCSMVWQEKNSLPFIKGQKKGEWQDVCDVKLLNCPAKAFYTHVPRFCPQTEATWQDTDLPSLGKTPPNRSATRMLCIKVILTDGCTSKKTVLRFNQYISVRSGKLISIVPPNKSRALENYCNK